MTERPAIRRALIKLSGEGLAGPGGRLDPGIIRTLAGELKDLQSRGKQIAIVVGGGNFLRGAALGGVHRTTGDQMGMLATVMNGLALRDAFESEGVPTRVVSSIPVGTFCEVFSRIEVDRHLNSGRVVVLVGGTGNPFFTTDTAAALRACEIDADCLLKATQVDGVYTADPKVDPNAQRFDELTYDDVIQRGLKVMDTAAVVLCMESRIPILVFDLHESGNMIRACEGEAIGTLVTVASDS